ncbi:hypothetical protein Tco_0954931 [Tanacetum coccineum]|uniref:Uncharacterized protein n=1 Tax=Tanacetum coccineum TaxID=301880 RepID=A0ABQ5E5T0_9ASTR
MWLTSTTGVSTSNTRETAHALCGMPLIKALNTAVHVINLTPCVPLRFDVPDRVWSGKDVSYHHLRVFGCKASVHIPKDERSKLDVRLDQMRNKYDEEQNDEEHGADDVDAQEQPKPR